MITIVRQGHTDVPVHTGAGQPGDRDTALNLINRCMVTYAAGMRAASTATLAAEAWRLEAQQSSPVVRTMRAIVAAAQAGRAGDRTIDWDFAPAEVAS